MIGETSDFDTAYQPNGYTASELVFRGCLNEDTMESPWEDGWEEKNHCKKDSKDVKICTCKEESMCNGSNKMMGSAMFSIMGAIVLSVLSR